MLKETAKTIQAELGAMEAELSRTRTDEVRARLELVMALVNRNRYGEEEKGAEEADIDCLLCLESAAGSSAKRGLSRCRDVLETAHELLYVQEDISRMVTRALEEKAEGKGKKDDDED